MADLKYVGGKLPAWVQEGARVVVKDSSWIRQGGVQVHPRDGVGGPQRVWPGAVGFVKRLEMGTPLRCWQWVVVFEGGNYKFLEDRWHLAWVTCPSLGATGLPESSEATFRGRRAASWVKEGVRVKVRSTADLRAHGIGIEVDEGIECRVWPGDEGTITRRDLGSHGWDWQVEFDAGASKVLTQTLQDSLIKIRAPKKPVSPSNYAFQRHDPPSQDLGVSESDYHDDPDDGRTSDAEGNL